MKPRQGRLLAGVLVLDRHYPTKTKAHQHSGALVTDSPWTPDFSWRNQKVKSLHWGCGVKGLSLTRFMMESPAHRAVDRSLGGSTSSGQPSESPP